MIKCVILLARLSRLIATDSSPASGFRPIVAILAAWGVLLSGCVSLKYKMTRENTPRPSLLSLVATQPPFAVALNQVIIYQGPGSWKHAAFWDEYVVTLHNQGDQPLSVAAADLTDFTGTSHAPGADPWALEEKSKTLEQEYRAAGVAFVRNAAAGAVMVGAGAGGLAAVGGVATFGAVGVFAATGVVVPIYILTVAATNSDNKAGIVAEFNRRRLTLPLTLAPGETRIGSLFFPMIPSPRALTLHWAGGLSRDGLTLSLDSVHGLHVNEPAPASTGK